MRRTSVIVILSYLLCASLSDAQASEHDISPAILKYVDGETTIVGWIDLSQLDFNDVQTFLKQFGGPGMNNPKALESIQAALLELGVTRVYLLTNVPTLGQSGPASFLVETAQPDKVQILLTTLASDTGGVVEREDNVIIAADTPAEMKRLRIVQGTASPKLVTAVRNCQTPHGIVMWLSEADKVSAINLLPRWLGDHVDAIASTAGSISETETVSLSGQLPPTRATLTIKAESAEAATNWARCWKRLISQTDADPDGLVFTADNANATWSGSSLEEFVAAFRVINLLAHMDLRPAATATKSLKQIVLAQHNFHDVYQHFAPQSLIDADGRRLLSWRVLILPYLGEAALYEKFRLDEPWDSPHNIALVDDMPVVYTSRKSTELAKQGRTRFVELLAENSVFGRRGSATSMFEITDGTSNTLMCVEAAESKAVVWTKPEDITVDERNPMLSIANSDENFHACFCDGAARKMSTSLTKEQLKALISMNGRDDADGN